MTCNDLERRGEKRKILKDDKKDNSAIDFMKKRNKKEKNKFDRHLFYWRQIYLYSSFTIKNPDGWAIVQHFPLMALIKNYSLQNNNYTFL